jgi:hypothetical protein
MTRTVDARPPLGGGGDLGGRASTVLSPNHIEEDHDERSAAVFPVSGRGDNRTSTKGRSVVTPKEVPPQTIPKTSSSQSSSI